MKKLLTIIAILLVTITSHGQELNREAEYLKNSESFQQDYEQIKKDAITKWGTDFDMVVYQINNQSKAFIKMLDILEPINKGDAEYDLLIAAMAKWGYDYEMIIYEYERQLKALKQL